MKMCKGAFAKVVIPAKAGNQSRTRKMDSRWHGNDTMLYNSFIN